MVTSDLHSSPLVTVVIPVFCHTEDHKAYLREALESVAAQTFRESEVVIIDDVSPIDIVPIVESIGGLPRTRIIRNALNMRQAESRNVGIRHAEGELIAFLDHDDLWLPEKLQRQVETMLANPDAAMVFCDSEVFGATEGWPGIDQSSIPERPSFPWLVSRPNCTVTASAVMVKKQAMLDIGLFDSRYSTCDDFDAWLKILMLAPAIHIAESLAKYRLHEYNVNYGIDRLNDNRLLTALIWRYWRRASFVERLRLLPRLGRKYIGRAYFTLRPGRAASET